MSRMGNKPIALDSKVKIDVSGQDVVVTGPKGTLKHTLPEGITFTVDNGEITVARDSDARQQKMLHGTTRSLLNAMVVGVSTGFKIDLELSGVGYRGQLAGNKLSLSLGFSKPIEYIIPKGVTASMSDQTHISLESIDKQLVGQVAATIRGFRPPDAYHGKGVRYAGEKLTLKEGKKVGA